MPKKTVEAEVPVQPKLARPSNWELLRICLGGWLVPGLGHLLLGRKWRALILFAAILGMYSFGLAMKGEFYTTGTGSLLETLGYFGELCVGVVKPASSFFGYSGGDPFFVSSDYGTAYLVAAGMLNVLAVLDAYDLAMGRKP